MLHHASNIHKSLAAPRISILSDSAKHVEHQSALNLTCVMNAVSSDGGQKWPKMVWYKDGKVSIHNNVIQFSYFFCLTNTTKRTSMYIRVPTFLFLFD